MLFLLQQGMIWINTERQCYKIPPFPLSLPASEWPLAALQLCNSSSPSQSTPGIHSRREEELQQLKPPGWGCAGCCSPHFLLLSPGPAQASHGWEAEVPTLRRRGDGCSCSPLWCRGVQEAKGAAQGALVQPSVGLMCRGTANPNIRVSQARREFRWTQVPHPV